MWCSIFLEDCHCFIFQLKKNVPWQSSKKTSQQPQGVSQRNAFLNFCAKKQAKI